MNTRTLRTLTLIAGIALSAVALGAQGGPGRGPGGYGQGRGPVEPGSRLGLSEAQKEQFKAIHERHKAALDARRQAIQESRQALRQAMKANADAKALKAAHQKVADAEYQMLLERKAVRDEILPILTPEQKAKFEEAGQRGGFRGHGAGMGAGKGACLQAPTKP